MSFENIKLEDNNNIANTYKRNDVLIKSGKNATCFDEAGKEYIDFTSGIGVNSVGFANEEVNKAIIEQINNLSHISNLFYTTPQVEVASKLVSLTKMNKVFFSNSGAEANEGAIKCARKYSFDKYGNDRNEIITLLDSFHGRTIATLSATGQDYYHNYFFPFVEGFVHAKPNNFENLLSKVSDKTCAIMIETIQGEGGVNPLDVDFVKSIEKLCNEKDILLIVDEVQTGIGRTGKLFSYEHFGIKPDIVTTAKGLGGGLPIGCVLFGEKTENVFTFGNHGTTFGGNPVSLASANKVLDIVANDMFLSEVTIKGEYIKNKLLTIDGVKEVYNKGLMFGITLDSRLVAQDVVKKCIENGLLVLTAKHKIRFLPPLTISYNEINVGLLAFEEALK